MFLVFALALMVGVFGVYAGICAMPSCFKRRCSVFWRLRWHLRYAFVLQASLFGVLAFALASAICLRGAGVGLRLLVFALASAIR
ncbi:hypothetical protein [Paraburkholderia terrae]|uniref:hypothetical protein n=1 Tax=Paraburkholderia terrae TaxID=311230 RepID=UPI001E551E56|nr:hypothetical protein [Paraburkholderia terrae]